MGGVNSNLLVVVVVALALVVMLSLVLFALFRRMRWISAHCLSYYKRRIKLMPAQALYHKEQTGSTGVGFATKDENFSTQTFSV